MFQWCVRDITPGPLNTHKGWQKLGRQVRKGENPEAHEYLQQAVRLGPQLASAHYQLARVHQRETKCRAALRELAAALRLNPNNDAVHYVRGQVLKQMGRTSEAREEMNTSTRITRESLDKKQRELEAGLATEPEILQELR